MAQNWFSAYGPFFLLTGYVYFTHLFDQIWYALYAMFRSKYLRNITQAIGMVIGLTMLKCPKQSMVDECPNVNVTFWLYNNNTQVPYQLNEMIPETLENAPFNLNTPIKILVHGYDGWKDDDPNPQIRPNYVSAGYNVISVDYRPVARKPCYTQSVKNSPIIGRCMGNFLHMLLKHNQDLDIEWFHLIGFSLGAHVSAFAGQYSNNKGIIVPRLTVLDAAAPMFYMNQSFTDMTSARFIDAIHTNVGLYGKTANVGDVDFYVNFLLFQRGCGVFDVSCNHLRAPIYFGESIMSTVGFWGYPLNEAKGVQIMGEHIPLTARGSYYLSTNSEAPYASGHSFPIDINLMKDRTHVVVDGTTKVVGLIASGKYLQCLVSTIKNITRIH